MGQFTPMGLLPRTVGDPRSNTYWDSTVRSYPARRRTGIPIDYRLPGPPPTLHELLVIRYRALLDRPQNETTPVDAAEAALLRKLITRVPPGHELENLAKWEQRFQSASAGGVQSLTDASGETWIVTTGLLKAFRRIRLLLESDPLLLKPPPQHPPLTAASRPPTHPGTTASGLCPVHRLILANGYCPACTRGRNHAGNRQGGSF